jgi:hypothetical protein
MTTERYVVLGLARARSTWFRSLAQWSNAGSIPVELVKCVSAEELSAHLRSGRPHSAVLVDSATPALDRDLIGDAHRAGCAVVVIDDNRRPRDWKSLGADAVVPAGFGPSELLDVLATSATVERVDHVPEVFGVTQPRVWRGTVAAVCGAGGAGASTVAMALAQLLGGDVRDAGLVLLADMARVAHNGLLHDVGDIVPDLQDAVDAHRSGPVSPDALRALTFSFPSRGYHLLLGLRRPAAWPAIRPRAFDATMTTLTAAFRIVICDIDADLEGEAEGGSLDVEERNTMSRVVAGTADVVYAVGRPGVKGVHSLVRVLSDLITLGVPPERIIPVVNASPRGHRARLATDTALDALLPPGTLRNGVVHIPERNVDRAFRDGVPLPNAVVDPLRRSWKSHRTAEPRVPVTPSEPERIAPGSLPAWGAEDEIIGDERAAG